MTVALPHFGDSGVWTRRSQTTNPQHVGYYDGLIEKRFVASRDMQLSRTHVIRGALGFANHDDTTNNSFGSVISSASLSIQEISPGPEMMCSDDFNVIGGAEPNETTDKLVRAIYLPILGVRRTMQITFAGDPPALFAHARVGIQLTGTFVIASETVPGIKMEIVDPTCMGVSESDGVTEFSGWQITLDKFYPKTLVGATCADVVTELSEHIIGPVEGGPECTDYDKVTLFTQADIDTYFGAGLNTISSGPLVIYSVSIAGGAGPTGQWVKEEGVAGYDADESTTTSFSE